MFEWIVSSVYAVVQFHLWLNDFCVACLMCYGNKFKSKTSKLNWFKNV